MTREQKEYFVLNFVLVMWLGGIGAAFDHFDHDWWASFFMGMGGSQLVYAWLNRPKKL